MWVDADSFPVRARDFLISHSIPQKVKVCMVANHEIKVKNPEVKMIVCEKGKDSADNYIFSNTSANDIVLTRDILFAARLVEKKICVMNDRGLIFSKDNIEDKLREREFSLNLSEIGFGSNKGNYYGDKELRKFSSVYSEELQKHIIADIYNVKMHADAF
ncbi:DUF188 domain-containing protein [uncultured Treponema sp.]|uniref:DUF188 domain-containing protein n=1 Tax=uncultured Treponema sp. TaxID=162155 RepID=UPI0025E9BCA2|nr:DUF188 domain-containing protein [uncultured Treponema sp.]